MLTIEVWFDLICPWCLIGKRNLTAALARFSQLQPKVATQILWRSMPLLPDVPPEGLPYQEFYLRRLGSEAAITTRRGQVQASARAAGVEIHFDRIQVMPSSLPGHRLIAAAVERGLPVDDLVEALFNAYFVEGRDIGCRDVLTQIALAHGLDEQTALACWSGEIALPDPSGLQAANGVPLFVFNRRLAVSGAQPVDVLISAAEQALSAG